MNCIAECFESVKYYERQRKAEDAQKDAHKNVVRSEEPSITEEPLAKPESYEWLDVQQWRQHIRSVCLWAPWMSLHKVTLPYLPYRHARQLMDHLRLVESDLPLVEGQPVLILHDGVHDLPCFEEEREQPAIETPTRHAALGDDEGSPLTRPNDFVRRPSVTMGHLIPPQGTYAARHFRSDIAVLCTLQLSYGQLRVEEASRRKQSLDARIAERSVVPPQDRDLWDKAKREQERRMEAALVNDPHYAKMKVMQDRINTLQAENSKLRGYA